MLLAANTAYADFPRLASIVARDGFLPRQFFNRGARLVFSNGVIFLALSVTGVRERIIDAMNDGMLYVATEGDVVGQINALSVYDLGDISFGRPSRVTCIVSAGRGPNVMIWWSLAPGHAAVKCTDLGSFQPGTTVEFRGTR